MLDDLGVILVDKYLKPCKKCLVRATCEPFKIDCDKWNKYIDQRDNAEETGSEIESYILLIALIVGTLFIGVTFGLGIREWIRIIL